MKRQGLSKLFTTGVFAASLLASSSAASAQNIFLKIDKVTGESQDSKHKGSIDIMSWSWGASTGTGRTVKGQQPAACVTDLHVLKETDSSSPELIMNSVTGEVAQNAVLTVRKAGGTSAGVPQADDEERDAWCLSSSADPTGRCFPRSRCHCISKACRARTGDKTRTAPSNRRSRGTSRGATRPASGKPDRD